MAIQDTRLPIGRLDFDTEDRLLPKDHYRYAKNGRSGTSDKDGDGSTENYRSNILRSPSFVFNGMVIGTTPDVRNNAVVEFVAAKEYSLTYTSAQISNTSPVVMNITGAGPELVVGVKLRITQSTGTFIATVTTYGLGVAVLSVVSGTPTVNPITAIKYFTKNYIRRWVEATNTFENLTNPNLMSDVLNFDTSKKILNAKIIESSFGQLLTWVETPNGIPCLMNIDRMKQGGEYYSTAADEQYIRLAKQPSTMKPTVSIVDYFQQTEIGGKGFQFAIMYVYDDNQKTVLSPFSDVVFSVDTNQAVNVSFYTGHTTVKEVKVIKREGNGVSETATTNPIWYEVYALKNPTPMAFESYNFTNTELSKPIARIVSDKLFESIPNNAGTIEVTDNNQIILGDITESYDNIEISNGIDGISLTAQRPTVPLEQVALLRAPYTHQETPISNSRPIPNFTLYPTFQNPPTVIAEGIIYATNTIYSYTRTYPNAIRAKIDGRVVFSCSYTGSASPGLQRFKVSLNLYVNGIILDTVTSFFFLAPPISDLILNIGEDVYLNQNDTVQLTVGVEAENIGPSITDITVILKNTGFLNITEYRVNQPSFKENSIQEIGVCYYDNYLRTPGVIPLETLDISSIAGGLWYPTPTDVYYDRVRVRIGNRPPNWAYHYSMVVKETSYDYGWITSASYTQVADGLEVTYENLPSDFEITNECYARAVGQATATVGVWASLTFVLPNLKVYSIDTSTKKIILSGRWEFPTTEPIIIEFYNPSAPTVFYYETKFFEIGNPTTATRYHKSDLINQSPTDPIGVRAEFYITGDSYVRFTGEYIGYSKSYNDAFESNYWNKGRPLIALTDNKQQKLTNVFRWGNKLINNTQVNNLSEWDEGNYGQVDAFYGPITGLRQIGYTLKIIQWSNYNTAFIGRREVQNADGSTQLVVTDNLVGTINPSETEFGTKYPTSIINTGRRIYFFDSLKSSFVVDDGNGLNEVAMYQGVDGAPSTTMSKYFRQLSTTINGDSDFEIITGFDYLYRDLYLTILNRVSNTQETLYYNEMQNAWKYFVDMEHVNLAETVKYLPDFYGNVGQVFTASMEGNLFQFNKGVQSGSPTYSELFKINPTDPLKPLIVETIGMIEPDKVKVFLTSTIHANMKPTLVEITVPPNEMYPNGMYSVLKQGNFAYREGVFYADIKRDAYTKGFTTDPEILKRNIASGRPMRGHVCLVRITFTENQYVKLFSTSIGMIPSELS